MLDVEGTVSRIYRDEEHVLHQDEPGWRSWMSVDDDAVDVVDSLFESLGIDVTWLTPWPHDQVGFQLGDRGLIDRIRSGIEFRPPRKLSGPQLP